MTTVWNEFGDKTNGDKTKHGSKSWFSYLMHLPSKRLSFN